MSKLNSNISTQTIFVDGIEVIVKIEHDDEFNVNSGDVIGVDKYTYRTCSGRWLGKTISIDGDGKHYIHNYGLGKSLVEYVTK